MGSTRYKNKVIKKIYKDKSILDFIIERLKILDKKIIIATTNKKRDNIITEIAKNYSMDYYRGDEDNVLKRYINSAKHYGVSKIIRITGDNVFIQPELIKPYLKINDHKLDYATYKVRNINAILTHWGLFSEYVLTNTLKKVARKTQNKEDLEHVTYYIYNHPREFNIKYFDIPEELNRLDIRLTIDTKEDFENCRKIIYYLEENDLEWNFKNILNFILDQPEIFKKMKSVIESQQKREFHEKINYYSSY